ncbi:MAG: hypothetical protein K6C40_14010 [Thermoguttaceae bacterium]|nr:hypothetical protein [Thermoguttaceae bacterium]
MMETSELIPAVIFLALVVAVGFCIWLKFKYNLSQYAPSEEWDDIDEYLDYLPIVKELLKDTKPSEVFEPDPEINRLRKETQRLALTFKRRLLRRLLKKGPDPDPKADEDGDDDQVLDE